MDKKLPENNIISIVSRSPVKPADQQRDELVLRFIRQAKMLQATIKTFKDCCINEVETFIDTNKLDNNYETNHIDLLSSDGRYRLQSTTPRHIEFTDDLQVAKKLIDNCIKHNTHKFNNDTQAIIESAFKTNDTGKINLRRIFNLKHLEINDDEWKTAMRSVSNAIQVIDDKNNLSLYECTEYNNHWQPILLDLTVL